MTATAAPAVIRQWARRQGIEVGDRGRLAPEVIAADLPARGAAPGRP
ncbi:MAG: Lsr2 family protein [Actinobacteria bacterium]|nr:Lsr2 family protein [Actinomycetota bacterium]MBW3646861.1 Lsr2 family protein [Actinomycetota bacterium]